MKALPSFWGTRDVSRIIDVYMHPDVFESPEPQRQLDKLAKFMAKQLPSKVLLSALLQSWPTMESIRDRVRIVSTSYELSVAYNPLRILLTI